MKTMEYTSVVSPASRITTTTNVKATWFSKQAENFEKTRLGWMAIYITVQSCVGSIACMYILQNAANDSMLITAAVLTMLSNAVFIAQGPGKICLAFFYLSIALNALFIVLNM
ncbi:MAG: hypothetical protein V4608_13175 [Bacteroidota bacterium]